MKSQDLRIGNLIYNETEDDIVPVEASDLLAMAQCELASKEVEWIAPVPLSEEMLILQNIYYAWKGIDLELKKEKV